MKICAYQMIDKGKGSCNGKCGEWWYYIVYSIGLIHYNVKHLNHPKKD